MRPAVLVGALLATACGPELSVLDAETLRASRECDRQVYVLAGASTPEGQLARGAYCGVDGVLRRADAGVENDAGIVCQPKR